MSIKEIIEKLYLIFGDRLSGIESSLLAELAEALVQDDFIKLHNLGYKI